MSTPDHAQLLRTVERVTADKDLLAHTQAALADPAITIPGFDSSRVFALISVVLSSPSSPRKRLLRAIKTVYLFQIDNEKGETGTWWLDMRVRLDEGLL